MARVAGIASVQVGGCMACICNIEVRVSHVQVNAFPRTTCAGMNCPAASKCVIFVFDILAYGHNASVHEAPRQLRGMFVMLADGCTSSSSCSILKFM
jgi:hypothetical protein